MRFARSKHNTTVVTDCESVTTHCLIALIESELDTIEHQYSIQSSDLQSPADGCSHIHVLLSLICSCRNCMSYDVSTHLLLCFFLNQWRSAPRTQLQVRPSKFYDFCHSRTDKVSTPCHQFFVKLHSWILKHEYCLCFLGCSNSRSNTFLIKRRSVCLWQWMQKIKIIMMHSCLWHVSHWVIFLAVGCAVCGSTANVDVWWMKFVAFWSRVMHRIRRSSAICVAKFGLCDTTCWTLWHNVLHDRLREMKTLEKERIFLWDIYQLSRDFLIHFC